MGISKLRLQTEKRTVKGDWQCNDKRTYLIGPNSFLTLAALGSDKVILVRKVCSVPPGNLRMSQ